MSNAVTTHEPLVTDPQMIQQMRRAISRGAARRAGIEEADIERSVYVRWRLDRAVLLHTPETEGEPVVFPAAETA